MDLITEHNGLCVFIQMLADSSNWRWHFTDGVSLLLSVHSSGAELSHVQCEGRELGQSVMWCGCMVQFLSCVTFSDYTHKNEAL